MVTLRTVRQSKVITIYRVNRVEEVPTTATPRDVIAVRGDKVPKFRDVDGVVRDHPAHVDRTHSTVLHISREAGDEIEWRCNVPFSIFRISEHDKPAVDARPFAWGFPRASSSGGGPDTHVLRSDVQEPDAHGGLPDGKLYKAWFKFEDDLEPLDPDFNCNP